MAGQANAAPVRPTALVPKNAVIKEADQSYVFVVAADTVERRAITTGGTDGDRVEVLAGVRGADRVVLSPPPALKAGMKIRIKQ